jgi:hypothetical protein
MQLMLKHKNNPAGKVAGKPNSADTTSKLTVTMNVEVPIHGTIEGLIVLDTMDLELPEAITSADAIVLRSVISNDFPLDGNIQMYFVDAAYNILDSLVDGVEKSAFMLAASTDPSGVTVKDAAGKFVPQVTTNDFTLGKATLLRLAKTKYLILEVKISSGNNGTDVMKILSSYNMNIKLGVIAKLQVGELVSGE